MYPRLGTPALETVAKVFLCKFNAGVIGGGGLVFRAWIFSHEKLSSLFFSESPAADELRFS